MKVGSNSISQRYIRNIGISIKSERAIHAADLQKGGTSMFKVTKNYLDKVFYVEFPDDVAQLIIDDLDDDAYDDMLDECYGEVEICGMTYSPSYALYNLDPVAYRCGRDDYYDSFYGDIVYELGRMDYGDTEYFYGYTVELIDDDEETA